MIKIRKLVWEAWNVEHIAGHDVTPDEIEEICHEKSQTEGAKKGRIRITGRTKKGRTISAFLDPEREDGVYYPVSARIASLKERKSYEAWSKGGEEII